MRVTQGTVRYESKVKQTSAHVHHEANTYTTWDIDHSDHNNIPILAFMFSWTLFNPRMLSPQPHKIPLTSS